MFIPAVVGDVAIQPDLDADDDVTIALQSFDALKILHFRCAVKMQKSCHKFRVFKISLTRTMNKISPIFWKEWPKIPKYLHQSLI